MLGRSGVRVWRCRHYSKVIGIERYAREGIVDIPIGGVLALSVRLVSKCTQTANRRAPGVLALYCRTARESFDGAQSEGTAAYCLDLELQYHHHSHRYGKAQMHGSGVLMRLLVSFLRLGLPLFQ
jgi:hypothetical protein